MLIPKADKKLVRYSKSREIPLHEPTYTVVYLSPKHLHNRAGEDCSKGLVPVPKTSTPRDEAIAKEA